jgi:hypothetical protein
MLSTIYALVHPILPIAVLVLGLVQLWRGLRGEPNGEGGLVRRHTSALGRMEGFRTTTSGLVLAGLGTGWLLENRLLIFLALGIGIVELRESSTIIKAVKGEPHPSVERQAPLRGH